MARILLILRRELQELRRNRTFFQTMALLPIILVLLPLGVVLVFNVDLSNFAEQNSPGLPGDCTQLAGLKGCDKADIIAGLLTIAFSFFLPVPAVLPMTIAAYSLVGEKERKSLEPLLATPVRTNEVLLGKGLSALVPSTLLCWFSFGALLVILRILLPVIVWSRLDWLVWVMTIGVWTPLLAWVITMFGVTISARSRDARAAQQTGSLMALPIVGIVIGIAIGLFEMNWLWWAVGVAILSGLAFLSYRLALGMFERETILTRWK